MIIIVLTLSLLTVASGGEILEQPVAPERLPDGLVITEGAGLKGLAANWIVLVTLDSPKYPQSLMDKIVFLEISL